MIKIIFSILLGIHLSFILTYGGTVKLTKTKAPSYLQHVKKLDSVKSRNENRVASRTYPGPPIPNTDPNKNFDCAYFWIWSIWMMISGYTGDYYRHRDWFNTYHKFAINYTHTADVYYEHANETGKVHRTFVPEVQSWLGHVLDKSKLTCRITAFVWKLEVGWVDDKPRLNWHCFHPWYCKNYGQIKINGGFDHKKDLQTQVSACLYSWFNPHMNSSYPAAYAYEIDMKRKRAFLHCDTFAKKMFKESYMEACPNENERICGFQKVDDEYVYHIVCCLIPQYLTSNIKPADIYYKKWHPMKDFPYCKTVDQIYTPYLRPIYFGVRERHCPGFYMN